MCVKQTVYMKVEVCIPMYVLESIVDVSSHKSTTKRSLVTFDYLQSFMHAFLNVKACFLLLLCLQSV